MEVYVGAVCNLQLHTQTPNTQHAARKLAAGWDWAYIDLDLGIYLFFYILWEIANRRETPCCALALCMLPQGDPHPPASGMPPNWLFRPFSIGCSARFPPGWKRTKLAFILHRGSGNCKRKRKLKLSIISEQTSTVSHVIFFFKVILYIYTYTYTGRSI